MTALRLPRIFVASASESLPFARAVHANLDTEAEVTVWEHAFTALSVGTLEQIVDQAKSYDFGIFILSADDVAVLRGAKVSTVRDNVVLELGLFIGAIGLRRCFMLVPRGTEKHHLPSDLSGLTYATFNPSRSDGNHRAAVAAACDQIRANITTAASAMQSVTAYPSFQSSNIAWDALFATSDVVEILFMGSETWRNYHFARIQSFAQRPGTRLRVLLPDPTSRVAMSVMGRMFGETGRFAKKRVEEAVAYFADLNPRGQGSSVSIYGFDTSPRYSSFRFGDIALVAPYSHRVKHVVIPTMQCVCGDPLFTFIENEFSTLTEAAIEQGRVLA